MSASLQITDVSLRVADLDRSLRFYVDRVGFAITARTMVVAQLAPAPGAQAILTLTKDSAASPASADSAGLFTPRSSSRIGRRSAPGSAAPYNTESSSTVSQIMA